MLTNNEFQCEEKVLPPIKVAAVRMHAPYSECGQGFAKIGKAFWNQISGPPLLLCYDTEYQEVANYEAAMPVKGGQSKGEIEVRELPAARCISLLHKGPYDQLRRSYEKGIAFVKSQGLTLASPCREMYLKGPGMFLKGNPKNYLTEIQLVVEEDA